MVLVRFLAPLVLLCGGMRFDVSGICVLMSREYAVGAHVVMRSYLSLGEEFVFVVGRRVASR